jgi:hypothetical protein
MCPFEEYPSKKRKYKCAKEISGAQEELGIILRV